MYAYNTNMPLLVTRSTSRQNTEDVSGFGLNDVFSHPTQNTHSQGHTCLSTQTTGGLKQTSESCRTRSLATSKAKNQQQKHIGNLFPQIFRISPTYLLYITPKSKKKPQGTLENILN